MRSDEHFTHDSRPESEDGQPTPEREDGTEQQTVATDAEQHEHAEHEHGEHADGQQHEHAREHGAHPCCPHAHHGHGHGGRGHGGRRHGGGHGYGHGFGHGEDHGDGHEHGFGHRHGFGPRRDHGHPTMARSIMKSARRIRRSGLSPEQLQHRIAATVSHADYVTTMRTLRRIGMDLRGQH